MSEGISQSTRDLVNLAIDGDERAFPAIIRRYESRVFAVCMRFLGHHQDAEDVAQEAFVRAIRALTNWDQSRAFEPWLLTIVANCCRSLIAKRQRRGPMHELLDCPLDNRWVAHENARHLEEEIALGLEQLPANQRQAFLYFHRDQLTYAEISARLGVPEGTSKTWVHRARKALAQNLLQREVCKGTS